MKYLASFFFLISSITAQTFWQKTNAPENLTINSFFTGTKGNIFISTDDGIYRSIDGGIEWEEKSTGLADKHVNNIIKDTNDNLIAGTRAGLFESSDYGESWIQLNIGLTLTDVRAMAIRNDGEIFISVVDSQFVYPPTIYLYSGGDTVEEIYNGIIGESFVKNFLTDNNDSVFALSGGGIILYDILYKWEDMNHQWIQVSQFSSALEIGGLAKNRKDYFFAPNNNGLIKSTDKGLSWLPADLYPNQVLSVIAESETSLFAGTYYFGQSGLYYSPDNGETWDSKNEGIENIPVLSFAFDEEGYLFAGTYLQGVYKSRDILTGITDKNDIGEMSFYLNQNYPNPFNPSTKISWQLPVGSWQTLKIYDMLGNEVATLVDEYRPAGTYEVEFSSHSNEGRSAAGELPSGIYFYSLTIESYSATKKMILLR